jgi:hypothetical protein
MLVGTEIRTFQKLQECIDEYKRYMEFVSAREQIAKQGLVEMRFFQELYCVRQERLVKLTLKDN